MSRESVQSPMFAVVYIGQSDPECHADEVGEKMSSFSGIDESSFQTGFLFALQTMQALGKPVVVSELVAFLTSVQEGDATLISTPEEQIDALENEVGKPMPERLRQTIYGFTQGAQGRLARENHKNGAGVILRMLRL